MSKLDPRDVALARYCDTLLRLLAAECRFWFPTEDEPGFVGDEFYALMEELGRVESVMSEHVRASRYWRDRQRCSVVDLALAFRRAEEEAPL